MVNWRQTVCIRSWAYNTQSGKCSSSLCVLEETRVGLSFSEKGEAFNRHGNLGHNGREKSKRHVLSRKIEQVSVITYITFFPMTDVIETKMVDTETLLRVFETPKPVTLHRSLFALPALATSEASQSKESEDIVTKHSQLQCSFLYKTDLPCKTHQPQ